MLKVWGRRSSFNVQKVMWLIGELELPHEHIDAGGQFGGLDAPDFLAMNPHGRIPLIRHLPVARPAALMTSAHFWVSVPM